jgi:hypothetical protein
MAAVNIIPKAIPKRFVYLLKHGVFLSNALYHGFSRDATFSVLPGRPPENGLLQEPLWIIEKKAPLPSEAPPMSWAMNLIARIGGYLGRKNDGPPRHYDVAWALEGPIPRIRLQTRRSRNERRNRLMILSQVRESDRRKRGPSLFWKRWIPALT